MVLDVKGAPPLYATPLPWLPSYRSGIRGAEVPNEVSLLAWGLTLWRDLWCAALRALHWNSRTREESDQRSIFSSSKFIPIP